MHQKEPPWHSPASGSSSGSPVWQARSEGLPGKAIRGLVQHPRQPKTLFALLAEDAKDPGGLYRTDDRARSWRRVSGETAWPDAKWLAIAPSDPQRLYVAARERYKEGKLSPGGVFASRDGGDTWERVLDDHFIEVVAVDPKDAGVLYAGGNDHPFHDDALGLGVMRSRDGGRTWESLNTPELTCRKVTCLTVDPHRPARLYAGTGGNGVFVLEPALATTSP